MNQNTKENVEILMATSGMGIVFLLLFASCGGAIGLFVRAFKFFA